MENKSHIAEEAKNEVDTPKKRGRIRIFNSYDEQREEIEFDLGGGLLQGRLRGDRAGESVAGR